MVEEIVVRVEEDALDLVIRWAGGDHTPLRVRKNRAGQHRWEPIPVWLNSSPRSPARCRTS
jgi:hypothetical protein